MTQQHLAKVFRFHESRFDPNTGTAVLSYSFDDGEPLEETLIFPYSPWPEDSARQSAFMRALGLLHLVAGVSYWKAALPERIEVGDHAVDDSLSRFLTETWTRGLGEFAYVNDLDLTHRIRFPVSDSGAETAAAAERVAQPLELPARALVAMGGGKDSLVSLQLMRDADMEVQPITVGNSTLIANTVKAAKLPLIRIDRQLAPRLVEMNAAGAWNGHVPVTAINSAILTCAALLYGYRWVVFSNERSAEEATLISPSGLEVNHQYSKSLVFERGWQRTVEDRVAPDLRVFSLLRAMGEVEVARRFSSLTEFHSVFSSCNRNFHRDGPRVIGRWCGNCPKCRFTTLALAPWVTQEAITAMVGVNLLDREEQIPGFRALCALDEHKPFECVGTIEECRALMARLATLAQWRDCAVIKQVGAQLPAPVTDLERLLELGGDHEIPGEVRHRVDL